MPHSHLIRNVLIAITFGAALIPVLWKLFEHSGFLTVWLASTFTNLGLGNEVHWLVRVSNAAIFTLVIGALFGIPLGLIVRGNPLPYWLILVATVLSIQTVLAWSSALGPGL